MTQQIDMSGAVALPHYDAKGDQSFVSTLWSDLTPFAQGTIRKALGGPVIGWSANGFGPPAYRDLAPETLAWFIAEGERWLAAYGRMYRSPPGAGIGGNYWMGRQNGGYPAFPPVTLTVRDDRLICVEAK